MQQKVTQQMKQHSSKTLKEHLGENDLKWLVDDQVLIDMHKTKVGADKDYMVLSIAVNDQTPAQDLATFLENSSFDFEDIEVSPATDTKGRYLVYVEMKRSSDAYNNILNLLTDSGRLCGIKDWKFKTLGLDNYIPFDEQSFNSHVITDPSLYEQQHPTTEDDQEDTEPETTVVNPQESVQESIKNRLKFLMNY